jgi:hypothetical protein
MNQNKDFTNLGFKYHPTDYFYVQYFKNNQWEKGYLTKDKSIVLEAVKSDGSALEYADESLKKDKSVVLVAVKQDVAALEFADESLKNDPDIIKAAKK